jgi:hypothetical protein
LLKNMKSLLIAMVLSWAKAFDSCEYSIPRLKTGVIFKK